MEQLIPVNKERQTTSARTLWEFLNKPWGEFMKWFNQFKDYGFVENEDYRIFEQSFENHQGRPSTDYEITIDMAKELAMLQKTEKGKQARQYFIEVEKQYNKSQIDTSLLSPQMQMFNQIFLTAANLEIEHKKLQAEVSEVKQTLYLVKDTVANHPEDNWRETINKMMNKIVNAVGGKRFQEIRSNSYKLLEERAGVNLNIRLDNYTDRLRHAGASKSKISTANKLDIIDQDKKLREIYTGIVKELTIKHVA